MVSSGTLAGGSFRLETWNAASQMGISLQRRCCLHQSVCLSRPGVVAFTRGADTSRTGGKVIAELELINRVRVVYSSRKLAQVEAWRRLGKDAVLLDLDQPETFPDAPAGIDRLFLVTGYTVAMVHQSKTIVDRGADADVTFIVHLGHLQQRAADLSVRDLA
jgi:hypothetical protein